MGEAVSKDFLPPDNSEYFDLINKKMGKKCQSSKERGGRREIKPTENIKVKKEDNKKNWKETLLGYLSEKSELGVVWCKELHKKIKNYKDFSEHKFLDEIFWLKFEVKNKPKCLEGEKREGELNKLQALKKAPKETDSYYNVITDKKDENSKLEYEAKRATLNYYINVLKVHLANKEHPINVCIRLFSDVFCKEIKYNIKEIKEEYKEGKEREERIMLVNDILTKQLIDFLFKLNHCLSLFYTPEFNSAYFESSKDDLTLLLSDEFFRNKKLYDAIFDLLSLKLKAENDEFIARLEHLRKSRKFKGPRDFKVQTKFSLDEETLRDKNGILEGSDGSEGNNPVVKNSINISTAVQKPYQSTISLLNQLNDFHSPSDKIELFFEMSRDILRNIHNFWAETHQKLPAKFLSLEGDDLINIFGYLIYESDVKNSVKIHLNFVKLFTTKSLKTSMKGYYYSTMEAAVLFIRDMKENNEGSKDTLMGEGSNLSNESEETNDTVINKI